MIFHARVGLFAVLGLALSGCGMFSTSDSERDPMELTDFDERIRVNKLWNTSVGSGRGDSATGLKATYVDGQIWAADYKGRVVAIDAESGERIRRFDLDMQLSAGPTVHDENVLVGTIEGQIVLLDRETGAIRWRAQLSSEILAAPLEADGVVVVRCIDGRVFGLDAQTGFREWVTDTSVPLLTLRGNSDPLIRAGQVFIGYDDGSLNALDLQTGDLLWEQRVGTPEGRTQLERLADIDGPMAIAGLDIYAASEHDRMASVALDSGRLLWVKEIGSYQGLQVDRTRLAVTDSDDRVWLLDRRSGSSAWSNEQLLRRGVTSPVLQGGFVVVADRQGYLHWLDDETGEFVARERPSRDAPVSAPLVVGNVLYLLDVDGKLSAWRVGASS